MHVAPHSHLLPEAETDMPNILRSRTAQKAKRLHRCEDGDAGEEDACIKRPPGFETPGRAWMFILLHPQRREQGGLDAWPLDFQALSYTRRWQDAHSMRCRSFQITTAQRHALTLCSVAAGGAAKITYSLGYTAPEVIQAVEAGYGEMEVSPFKPYI